MSVFNLLSWGGGKKAVAHDRKALLQWTGIYLSIEHNIRIQATYWRSQLDFLLVLIHGKFTPTPGFRHLLLSALTTPLLNPASAPISEAKSTPPHQGFWVGKTLLTSYYFALLSQYFAFFFLIYLRTYLLSSSCPGFVSLSTKDTLFCFFLFMWLPKQYLE